MPALQIHLFGHLRVSAGSREIDDIEGGKARELLGYLLVNRQRAHPRETLAGLLWGDNPTSQARKYLRQALWQLQTALDLDGANGADGAAAGNPLLLLEADAIRLNASAPLWLDVDAFEEAFGAVKGIPGRELSVEQAARVQAAVELYRGDLLEGWYQDWCIYERERLQTIYLILLDKLMQHCEAHGIYDLGLMYGEAILGIDRAREGTHRGLMRLHARAGERTAALRQYERCAAALEQELGVAPSSRTVALCEQIRADRFDELQPADTAADAVQPLPEIVERLQQLGATLAEITRQLQHELRCIERRR